MYTITFSDETLKDLLDHKDDGRQVYGAIVCPYSGTFTHKSGGAAVTIPKLVCPYQVNDIIAIQEQWARKQNEFEYRTYTAKDNSNKFRPATTMPDDAVRMYARIVSIRAWTVTKDIVDKYLSVGEIADAYPGSAKIIGYYDKGNELLSKIRKKRNKEVLDKTYQPVVTYNLPMVDKYVQYRLRQSTNYSYDVVSEHNPHPGHKLGVESVFAQAFEAYPVYSDSSEAQYLDSNFRGWQHTLKSSNDLAMKDSSLEYACKARGYNPPGGYEMYVYYRLDSNGNRIPTYATYKTKIVDPTKYLFAWLISGYLCDKDGKITGKWF